jgi:hypothetical protein
MQQSLSGATEQQTSQAAHIARADNDNVMPALLDFADDLDPSFTAHKLGVGDQASLLGGIDKTIERLLPRSVKLVRRARLVRLWRRRPIFGIVHGGKERNVGGCLFGQPERVLDRLFDR